MIAREKSYIIVDHKIHTMYYLVVMLVMFVRD